MTSQETAAPRRSAALPARTHWEALPAAGRWLWVLQDGLAILVLLGLVAAVLHTVYGTVWLAVTVGGFGLVGIGVAVLGALRRFGAGTVALLTMVCWFLFGTLLVMPSAGIGMVVPTGRSLLGLLLGPVTAWRDMLTLEPPIGETANLLAVPGLIALVAAVTGMSISLRTRAPMLAWFPASVGYVVAAALGASSAYHPIWLGVVFFVVVLVWTSHRRAHLRESLAGRRQRVRPLRIVLGVVTLLVAGAVAWASMPVLQPEASRTTVRQWVEPPISLEEFDSPLQAFRGNITKYSDTSLFEVSGLMEGDIVRVATMDSYDGMSFRVASGEDSALSETTFTRVGQWIDDDTPGSEGAATLIMRAYESVWVPTVGKTTQIGFDGARSVTLAETFFYNRASGTGLTTAGIRAEDGYSLSFIRPDRPSEDQIRAAVAGSVAQPGVDGLSSELRNRAHEWADQYPTAGAQVLELEARFRTQGFFSHGQPDEARSLSGHSEARLLTLIADPERMVGDGEQYASAMALMARELGIPARVVYGFRAKGTGNITGSDVGAWVEVNLDGLGWVLFSPTPPEDQTLEDEDSPQPPTPRPAIENPPPPPQRPEPPLPEEELPVDPGEPPVREERIDWAQIGAWVALTGIPLVTVVLPVALILGLKLRRRARRRNSPEVANRIAGAWSELVDRARDLGRSPSPSATRSEQAQQFMEDFAKLHLKTDPIAVSQEADWLVFAPGDPSEATAKEFWHTTKEMERGIRRSVSWPRWLASRLSTKSFKKVVK